MKGEDLGQPRAVAADDQGVWIGSWTKAELFRVGKWGKREEPVKAPASQLDGFTRSAGSRIETRTRSEASTTATRRRVLPAVA